MLGMSAKGGACGLGGGAVAGGFKGRGSTVALAQAALAAAPGGIPPKAPHLASPDGEPL